MLWLPKISGSRINVQIFMKIFTLKFPMIYQTPNSDTSTEKKLSSNCEANMLIITNFCQYLHEN